MYFPYLRGRTFELIALREFADNKGFNNNIIPIIEPVKKSFGSFKLAIPKLINGGVRFGLILNPNSGDYKKEEFSLIELEALLGNLSTWIPAFVINNNYIEIESLVKDSGYENVMLICTDLVDTSNDIFQRLVSSQQVRYIVSHENRTLKRTLGNTDKNLIRLDDNFVGQKRNVDYKDTPEEKFSEEHLFYKEDGFYGFADYTCLSSQYTEGGSAPYVVAIHLTFQKPNKEIWIRHFISTISSTSQANIQAKFKEAAEKALEFADTNGLATEAISELRRYYDEAKYPGLGMVKKIAIKHHLELINRII